MQNLIRSNNSFAERLIWNAGLSVLTVSWPDVGRPFDGIGGVPSRIEYVTVAVYRIFKLNEITVTIYVLDTGRRLVITGILERPVTILRVHKS